jgi:hypothetical protein
MLRRLAALRLLRLLRVWVACAALSLLPAPSAALAFAADVTVQVAAEAEHEERAPSEAATGIASAALAPHGHVASRLRTPRPARAVASAPRRALYLRHCSLLL